MSTSTPSISDVDAIRRQMAQIRREIHEDVQGVVFQAEEATDWRRYVKIYPWVLVGLAFGVGYWIVPKRRKIVVQAPELPEALTHAPIEIRKTSEKKAKKAGLIGSLFGMLGPVVLRAGQSYALGFVENWIAQQQGMMGAQPTGGNLQRPGPTVPPTSTGPSVPPYPRRQP